ncbi:hypothetical protein [Roseomonas gilardii]|uniref:hypothetical protein n=1 Tax=Roseomonas gilardii TaxID=257708 RepID=UPI001643911A|nr:hypothetical protein [Roseomonas gilardii]
MTGAAATLALLPFLRRTGRQAVLRAAQRRHDDLDAAFDLAFLEAGTLPGSSPA